VAVYSLEDNYDDIKIKSPTQGIIDESGKNMLPDMIYREGEEKFVNGSKYRLTSGKSSGIIGDTDGNSTITGIKTINFNDESIINREIENFCKEFAHSDIERSLEISPNGKAYNLSGSIGSVNPELIGIENLKGSIGIHNHPVMTGDEMYDSFSLNDLKFAAKTKEGKQFLISGKRRNAFEFIKENTEDEIYNAWKNAKHILHEKAFNGEIQISYEQYEILKILNNTLEGFVFYENF
jgi:hypothetical protein